MVFEAVLTRMREILSSIYSNAVIAIIILLVGMVLGRFLGKVVERLLQEIEINKILRKTTTLKISFDEVAGGIVAYLVYFVAIVMSLGQLGVATTVLNFILIAMLVVVVATILLGFRDFFPNVVAGVMLFRERLLKEGDVIKVNGVEGEIIKLSITEIRVKTKKDEIVYIPNSLLTKKEVVKLPK